MANRLWVVVLGALCIIAVAAATSDSETDVEKSIDLTDVFDDSADLEQAVDDTTAPLEADTAALEAKFDGVVDELEQVLDDKEDWKLFGKKSNSLFGRKTKKTTAGEAEHKPADDGALRRPTLSGWTTRSALKQATHLINLERQKCPGKPKPFCKAKASFAQAQVVEGVLYKIEATFSCRRTGVPEQTYHILLEELPRDKWRSQRMCKYNKLFRRQICRRTPRLRYELEMLKPHACAPPSEQLLSTYADVERHNRDPSNTFKKEMYDHHFGMTSSYFSEHRLGDEPLTEEEVQEALKTQGKFKNPYKGPTPPSFDNRDLWGNCLAHLEVNDQGTCGSCYAHAAATAYATRQCVASKGGVDIRVSAQEALDCYSNTGCKGGNAYKVFMKHSKEPRVRNIYGQTVDTVGWPEEGCEPYKGTDKGETCGRGACGNIPKWRLAGGRVFVTSGQVLVDLNGMSFENFIQHELMANGPIAASFNVYSDFSEYKSGVYVKSATAQKRGGHAVVILGWGEERGVKYWLAQNSWNKKWGINGYFKIRRGTDEVGIETRGLSGAIVDAQPQLSAKDAGPCASSSAPKCCNGGTQRFSRTTCSCECRDSWTGPTCTRCNTGPGACEAGTVDPRTCKCKCPVGYEGTTCQKRFEVVGNAFCKTGTMPKFVWAGNTVKGDLMKKSYFQVWKASEYKVKGKAPVGFEYVCSGKYNTDVPLEKQQEVNSCGVSGSKEFKSSLFSKLSEGSYVLQLCKYLGYNEFGQDKRWSCEKFPQELYMAASSSSCSASSLASKKAQLDAATQAAMGHREDPNMRIRLKNLWKVEHGNTQGFTYPWIKRPSYCPAATGSSGGVRVLPPQPVPRARARAFPPQPVPRARAFPPQPVSRARAFPPSAVSH
eukprot:CAMPEP_0114567854 /NCGR_PEP_ID=MMETSP0114-20121206/15726_1 /TAXON_ID=31324 /ORGANISM="Goniomonas sp, Strain m" /LENGTH=884 /DNA_ID=CAMNT_0001754517 /DNA_START=12 /DNA_END=2662 /DNA_ORIENTATION=+